MRRYSIYETINIIYEYETISDAILFIINDSLDNMNRYDFKDVELFNSELSIYEPVIDLVNSIVIFKDKLTNEKISTDMSFENKHSALKRIYSKLSLIFALYDTTFKPEERIKFFIPIIKILFISLNYTLFVINPIESSMDNDIETISMTAKLSEISKRFIQNRHSDLCNKQIQLSDTDILRQYLDIEYSSLKTEIEKGYDDINIILFDNLLDIQNYIHEMSKLL